MAAEPAQAAQQVRHVGPEHSSHHVELVDDDVAESHEEVVPALVGREYPRMEHLGIGQDHVRVRPDPGAVGAVGVAVVGGGHYSREVEPPQGAELVLGQGLGGEHQQGRCRIAVTVDRLGYGDLEAERLSRGCSRGDRY